MEPKLKLVRKQNLVELLFHGTVEHVEPQFVNLLLSNNASHTIGSAGVDETWVFHTSALSTVVLFMVPTIIEQLS